ncbi:LacI family DNA-binding transcriptional regulator [Novosphingobium humi]|uniref:LacI family DNA-binding transcriptional regulator n=1 Tax=Novosphingobium humi TaxID=2282397 RepID=A0ABY7TVH1_9SPHN|nr:LacI family DNA-binding transcriptional regulator [Novosphingobium humi]WCT76616.1 LacI family DNA-binding transcriptional regulator [Novosphingobium humi]
MSSRRATGSDVARVAGVSKSAVSRAFTGGIVSDEARKRIMDAARILRYRPNASARSLITSRSRLLGLAITSLDNQFYPALVEQLHESAAAAGYRIVLFITHGEADLDPVLDELLRYQLDGVILASSSLATRVARECIEAGVPVVMLNNIDPEGKIAGVCADNAHGARAVAEYLLAQGRRRLGLITGLGESSAGVERAQSFMQAVAEHPQARLLTACGHFTAQGAYDAARSLLERDEPAQSLFCVTDFMALSALQAVRDLGLAPGRDVAVFGFDDAPIAAWGAFELATYASPLAAMVQATLALLQDQIEGGERCTGTLRLKGQLMVRASGSKT